MFIVIIIMLLGLVLGIKFQKKETKWLDKLILGLIGLLLFLLGWEIGNNQEIIGNFASLGWKAFIIAFAATLGSVIAAKILWHFSKDKFNKQVEDKKNDNNKEA